MNGIKQYGGTLEGSRRVTTSYFLSEHISETRHVVGAGCWRRTIHVHFVQKLMRTCLCYYVVR